MLTRVRIENFKAWREADLTLAPITGFFGSNSAGKSSLLQFLLLLKQTKNATDRGIVLDFGGPADFVNLGTFRDVVHGHNDEERIRWILEWTLPQTLKIADPNKRRKTSLFRDNRLSAECEVGLRSERPWPYRLAYRFDGTKFRLQSQPDSEENFELDAVGHPLQFQFVRTQGRAWPLPSPVKTHLFPNQVRNYYQNSDFLADFELEYENLMDSVYYLGPLREYPRREYHWAGSSPEDVGQRGERTVDAILAATRDEEMRSFGPRTWRITFQRMIAHWLKKLGLIESFTLEEIAKGTNLYQAKVRTSRKGPWTSLVDVGFGVSQILPALVLLYYVPEGSIVLMEQPEIHLHPAVQSALADVMVDVARVRNVQIIVESHSEHLMRRLQRRVAEEKASPEEVKLYFVSSQRGEARVSDLQLNEWGTIENWPENFFGDEMGEIAAITEASLKRRLARSE